MPSTAYTLFRSAILREQQVTCMYDGRHRELCPHIIGTNRSGEEVVLARQFAGEFRPASAMAVPEIGQCQSCPCARWTLA